MEQNYQKELQLLMAENLRLQEKITQASAELQRRNKELALLTANIPGGVHQCKKDPYFTILSMSSGFLTMFGYTESEIALLFQNRFMNMIYAPDRETVAQTTAQQLAQGDTVEYEYRALCKDGTIIWVLDRGRVARAEDGTETFFCMMMDITGRKIQEEKHRLALERHQVIRD